MSFDLKIINNDLVINNGSLQTVVDGEKLVQDMLKMCLTAVGANSVNPWYGSMLSRTIVGNPTHTAVLMQMAKSQLDTAFNNLKTIQEFQVKTYQRVSADEQLSSILDISIMRDTKDPRLFNVKIKALSKGSKAISANFKINTI